MTLPRIGESLDTKSTLETKARQTMRDGGYDHFCSGCKSSPYPRGFCVSAGLCWYCIFPRAAVVP